MKKFTALVRPALLALLSTPLFTAAAQATPGLLQCEGSAPGTLLLLTGNPSGDLHLPSTRTPATICTYPISTSSTPEGLHEALQAAGRQSALRVVATGDLATAALTFARRYFQVSDQLILVHPTGNGLFQKSTAGDRSVNLTVLEPQNPFRLGALQNIQVTNGTLLPGRPFSPTTSFVTQDEPGLLLAEAASTLPGSPPSAQATVGMRNPAEWSDNLTS